jgi:hypothetical protein
MLAPTVTAEPASSMKHPRFAVSGVLAAVLTLAGCMDASPSAGPERETSMLSAPGEGPPDAPADACYGKTVIPAVIETVTEQVEVEPARLAADGTVLRPAKYRTSTRQAIVRDRRESFFEVPCPHLMTPDFIASVQRALKARNFYHGAATGVMDARTRRAIRAFQAPGGVNTDILTLETTRKLGLSAWMPVPG